MDLFVADRIPKMPPFILGLSGELYGFLTGAPAVPVQQSRFASYTSLAQAKADFRKDRRVRLLMDNGAAIPGSPGGIGSAWEMSYNTWPIKAVRTSRWFLGPNGTLRTGKPGKVARAAYTADPAARPTQTITDGSEWAAAPNYNWQPLAAGKGLGFVSPVLGRDAVIAGNWSTDLWLRSSARDTDLQITLTEVRPDGKETQVQNGWLRASHRKLYRRSTELYPQPTHLQRDARPIPRKGFTRVRVAGFPVAHAFRKGSRIRLNIQAPGGDRQIWDFNTLEDGKTRNVIAMGGKFPSRMNLPLLPKATAQGTPLPEPTALRGQPSREYVPATNGG
jgi:uncharacterized protein